MVDQELVKDYTEILQDLKDNNRIQIINCTEHARELQSRAESIAVAIEEYILQCESSKKLIVLYVLDSIVKNIKGSYVEMFAPRLLKIFSSVWHSIPEQQERLKKVLRLWVGHFSEETLQPIRDAIKLATPGHSTPLMSPESPGSYQPTRPTARASSQPGPGSFGYTAPAPHLLATGVASVDPAPQRHLSNTVVMSAVAVPTAAYQQSYPALHSYVQPVGPNPMHLATQAYSQAYHGMQPAGYLQAVPVPQAPIRSYTPPVEPHMYPQPPPPPRPASASAPASHHHQRSPQAAGLGHDDILTAIKNINVILENTSKPSTSGAGHRSNRGLLRTTDFSHAFLKDYHPEIIEELQELTEKHRPILLNIQFNRRRRQKLNPVRQRQWFATADQWVTVTASFTDAPPTFFEDAHEAAEDAPDCSEPVDESQPECAISGDSFEVFWDEATETHRYRHAKRLYGDEAEAYGVPDGSLVNVKSMLTFMQGDSAPGGAPATGSPSARQESSPAEAPGVQAADIAGSGPHAEDVQAEEVACSAANNDQQEVGQQEVGQKRPLEVIDDLQLLDLPSVCAPASTAGGAMDGMISAQKKLRV